MHPDENYGTVHQVLMFRLWQTTFKNYEVNLLIYLTELGVSCESKG